LTWAIGPESDPESEYGDSSRAALTLLAQNPWPRGQTALARALEIIPIRADICGHGLSRTDLGRVPRVVVFDLKP